jgi:hypothetical protein
MASLISWDIDLKYGESVRVDDASLDNYAYHIMP